MTQTPVIPPVVPDYIGGVVQRVKAHPNATLLAKLNGQISTALGKNWTERTYAVLIRRAGALPADADTDRMLALVDTFWYGPTEYEAIGIWSAYHYWICPNPNTSGMPNTYRPGPAGLVFDSVQHLAGPTFQSEERTGWAYQVARYVIRFSSVPLV